MDKRVIKIFLAILVVLFSVYALKEDIMKIWGDTKQSQTTTTTETRTNVSTTPMTTTTVGASNGTTLNPDILPECLMMKTFCKKDRCYFGNAINRHNTKFCEQINDPKLRNSCTENINSNQTNENAVIEGQVFNTRDCGVYPELLVEVKDGEGNITVGSMKTNFTGEYKFEVTPGKDYGIYVTIRGDILNQNLENLRNGTHIIDFAIS